MHTAGIICEYNPFHLGHLGHIEKTKLSLGEDCAIVCVMSGNFVQRGEPALFNKHSRAKAAIIGGADLVVELPTPYAISSAERFAQAGVYLLDSLGICDFISFGSESGDVSALAEAASVIVTDEADALILEWLGKGLPYAAAQQKAADSILGARARVFSSPNNLLGIEYLKALTKCKSSLKPLAVTRTGGDHDSDDGLSASRIRKMLISGELPWQLMPTGSAMVCKEEILCGRGPVSMKSYELAMLSRLRAIEDFSALPDASEGLDMRFLRCAASEPTIEAMLEKIKTKRYAMSRIRRMLMCACLGITSGDTVEPPPYIRVLAMNDTGKGLLSASKKKAGLPVITKPAFAHKLSERAAKMFYKEAKATDFYALAYQDEACRAGGNEWRQTPIVLSG